MNDEVFKVVRGSEATILQKTPLKGYVFFATDTRKIYYGDGETFLPMGGNTGVWYGTMIYSETPDDAQIEFNFAFTDLEGNTEEDYSLPNPDDLIFNTPDGCFYRVIEIEENSIKCYKLTVSGSGGGGGGGPSNVGYMTLNRVGDATINTLQGNSCFINFTFSAVDASGEATGQGTASVYVGGLLKTAIQIQQGDNSIDVGPYIDLGTNTVRLVVSGDIGGSSNITQSKTWTIISTNLAISWDYDETTINTAETITFRWTVSTVLAHSIHFDIDDYNDIVVLNYPAGSSRDKVYTIERYQAHLTHGSHKVKIYATADIGGQGFTSAAVTHQVICVDEGYADTIISVGNIPTEMNQYDTLSIPLIFYNPQSAEGVFSAILYEEGAEKDRWINYRNGVIYTWNYTPTTAGLKILTITSGTTEAVIRIQVVDLGLNIDEVSGYSFRFKASELTSNNTLKDWSYNNGAITPTFSENFDWVNGGFKNDEIDDYGNARNYVAIKAGNHLSFNYQPFAKENPQFFGQGFSLKVIFKAVECRKYNATVMTIGDSATDDVYFKLTANEGLYKAMGASVPIQYCEDSYIELELDIWPYGSGTEAYIMSWIDGVPASATTYENGTYFQQNNPKNIVFGSDDCDVQLYMIKIYQNHLTNDQHLNNFIIDAPNALEIVNRYNRNNILDDNGEISYKKLIEKNPNCDVYLYDIPRITTTKKDKVKGCSYQRYQGSANPLQTAENVTMAVQGTSSAAYGLAAFNFNSTFESGFVDYTSNPEGEHIDNWAMDENAIPINDYNTKVNVASCEGVNNALNQEWYDRFVNHVYVTEYKKKNPKSRHTMQFMNMGVVFLKDNNPNTNNTNGVENNVFNDTPGYINNPYYKMYSICNMGNIKRNEGVFSDPDNPYDVIMENPDNQSVYQQMTGNLDQNGKLDGIWNSAENKFYPYVSSDEYLPTSDTVAQANKVYYERTGPKGSYVYNEVENLVVNETSVEDYYEFFTGRHVADTEVFEWRSLPACWDEMGERGIEMRAEAENAWTDLVAWFAQNNPEAATNNDLIEPETYEAYVFKGYTSRADRLDKAGNPMPAYTPSNQILKGLSISTYAGTYTKDTKERRMAKMLSECEDHLIMDEIVFHYLFIERHCLIDNVAKNTFWHTEDLQHWSMIKDYDNDTSDGNDNSGHLTLTYGYEVLDHIDHDPNKSFVFNAAPSVWLHFIDGLLPARERVYQALDSGDIGAWDADKYLDIFNSWQSKLPERVWIEDYYRKYLRPNKVYGATQFLPMLEGGKKTYQRKQFEIYQEAYMSSEYFGRKCQNSLVDIRANGTDIASMEFPMTMYTNCYIRVAAGQGHDPNVRERYFRGQEAKIHLPVSGDANDMTTYFYLAHYITGLKNIEQLRPKKVDISAAYRLTKFSMDALESEDYYVLTQDSEIVNGKVYYKRKFVTVENPMAEDFDTYYLIPPGYSDFIDASENGYSFDPAATYFIFDGYTTVAQPNNADIPTYYEITSSSSNLNLTAISFNQNRMLEELKVVNCPNVTAALNLTAAKNLKSLDVRGSGFSVIIIADGAPVTTLYLNNPQGLQFDNLSQIHSFEITNNRLSLLNLNNIDDSDGVNSKDLVNMVTTDWTGYNLQKVQWIIDDSEELNVDETHLEIPILDVLLNASATRNLSGILTITENAYNGGRSLDLYNKYSVNSLTNFPNLDLVFTGSNTMLYEVTIKNGNDEVVWKRKTKGNYTVTSDFLSNGPYGAFDAASATIKADTESTIFTFTNKWKMTNLDTNTITEINGESPIINTQLSANIVLEPVFATSTRQYTITFVDGDGNTISSDSYDYGTLISDIIAQQTRIPNKDDSSLGIYETYHFLGYALSPTASTPIKFTNAHKVNNTYIYYAIFSGVVDVSESINVDYNNFTYIELDYPYEETEDPSFNIPRPCYKIAPKPGKILSGKITIPAFKDGEIGHPIVELGDFRGQNEIVGIFFERGTQIRRIGDSACDGLASLIYFEMPDNLRRIGSSAFKNCSSLRLLPRGYNKDSTSYVIGGTNLYFIGHDAFNNGIGSDCTELQIASGVSDMDNYAVSFLNIAAHLTKITFGTNTQASNLKYFSSRKPIKFNNNTNPPLTEGIYFNISNTISEEDRYRFKRYLNPYVEAGSSTNGGWDEDRLITINPV